MYVLLEGRFSTQEVKPRERLAIAWRSSIDVAMSRVGGGEGGGADGGGAAGGAGGAVGGAGGGGGAAGGECGSGDGGGTAGGPGIAGGEGVAGGGAALLTQALFFHLHAPLHQAAPWPSGHPAQVPVLEEWPPHDTECTGEMVTTMANI